MPSRRNNPGRRHLPAATAKEQRMYEHILQSELSAGRGLKRAKSIAAATVRAIQARSRQSRANPRDDSEYWSWWLYSIDKKKSPPYDKWFLGASDLRRGKPEKGDKERWIEKYKYSHFGVGPWQRMPAGKKIVAEKHMLGENPARRRNAKTPAISEADISKLSPAAQAQIRAQLDKVEAKEARAHTPAQKRAAAKSRRSFLARLGTRLRVLGQTKKYKVEARDLSKCRKRVVKVRSRHETDAISKAQSQLGRGFDQFKVVNPMPKKTNARGRGRGRNPWPDPYFSVYGGTADGGSIYKQKFKSLEEAKAFVEQKKAAAIARGSTWANWVIFREPGEREVYRTSTTSRNPRIRNTKGRGGRGRRRNLEHRDSDHPIEVHKHYRAGPPGYMTPWQRAHHAGQRQLFETGIKPATKRNASRRNAQSSDFPGFKNLRKEEYDFYERMFRILSRDPHDSHAKSGMERSGRLLGYTAARVAKDIARAKAIAKEGKSNPRRRRNQTAEDIRREFAGSVSGERDLFFPESTPNEDLAKLGKLVSITTEEGTIKPVAGTAWLCADTEGHLHVGSTSGAPLYDGPRRDFGEVSRIEYDSPKPHLGYPNPIIWTHRMGEEDGRRPKLVADGRGGIVFKGGHYRLTRRGIEN